MLINERIIKDGRSLYRLSKDSGIPYATLRDLRDSKTDGGKISAVTACRLAQTLGISTDELMAPYLKKRIAFTQYKSNVCHELKSLGDIEFIKMTLKMGNVCSYFELGWYPEALYLVAMVDYLSRIHGIPLYTGYEKYRHCRLDEDIYPAGIICLDAACGNNNAKNKAYAEAIPEFKRFGIIEGDIRDAV